MLKKNKDICIVLSLIVICLGIGDILMASYVYRSSVGGLFQAEMGVVWDALNVVVTAMVGVATIIISRKLAKLEEKQADIEIKQNRLYTEPHILVDSIEISSVEGELSADRTQFKTLKGVDYPYYSNIRDESNLKDSVLITVSIVNTYEAFARVRFNEASFENLDGNKIAEYKMSTFGISKSHIMIPKDRSGKIGFLLNRRLQDKLDNSKFLISTYLDNNFNECFKDTQNYVIWAVCEEKVSFMVCDIKQNSFEKVD